MRLAEIGRRLAERIVALGLPRPVVIGVRGRALQLAAPIARALGVTLEVLSVESLGGMGAVAETGGVVLDDRRCARLSGAQLRQLVARAERRLEMHRLPDLRGREVILVDMAAGLSACAALAALRELGASRVTLAVPSGDELREVVDRVVSLSPPRPASPAAPTASATSLRS